MTYIRCIKDMHTSKNWIHKRMGMSQESARYASTKKNCKLTQKEIKSSSLLNSCQDVSGDFH